MFKLNRDRYSELISLLDKDVDNVEVLGVLNCKSDGAVFVEDRQNITDFLVYSSGLEGFYLIGKSKGFVSVVKDFIYSKNKSFLDLDIDWVEISCESRDQMEELDTKIDDDDRELTTQIVYKYDSRTKSKVLPVLDDSYEVVNLLDLKDRINYYPILKERLETFWTSIELFNEEGFGYAVIKGSEVVSICLSAFNTHRYSAFEIETFEGYKKNGYGKIVALKTVSEAINRGLTPYWDCMGENLASQKCAESIGFKKSGDYGLLGVYVGSST